VVFLLTALAIALAPWIHPPLSADVRGIHASLGLRAQRSAAPEEFLSGARCARPDSVGVVLGLLVAVGLVVVVRRPERLGAFAGVLLAAALAANAACALNHPALTEAMDREFEQHKQMATLIVKTPEKKAMANPHNGRIGSAGAPELDEQRGDAVRGWVYLHHGRWLVLWAALGVLFGTAGSLGARVRMVASWAVVGVVLSGLACSRRLYAESCWQEAVDLEGRGSHAAARRALERSVAVEPEFGRLERTWLLAGKLDYRAGRDGSARRLFRAYQMTRDKEEIRAVAYAEDLPWLLVRTWDYRTGLATSPSGFYDSEKPDASETDAPYSRDRLSSPAGHLLPVYRMALRREPLRALGQMEDLLAGPDGAEPAVRRQASRMYNDLALRAYLDRPNIVNSEFDFYQHDRRLATAQNAWRRSAALAPDRWDSGLYLGLVQARLDPSRPERVRAEFERLMTGVADRPLRAEVLDLLGDAYWDAGEAVEARRRYAQSYDSYSLPKRPNVRAQKKLGGL
jgi:hypothetical protein